MTALRGLRIIELAEGVAGEYCGKLLADLGAELIKVEAPGHGSPTRAMAPLIHGKDGRSESGLFAYLNANKRSVTLDLSAPEGLDAARDLIATAAAVIDDHDLCWLEEKRFEPDRFAADFPSVLFTSLSNFGLDAPQDFAATKSLNVMHASGWGFHTGSLKDRSKPPLKGAGRFLADYEGAIDGAICTMAGLVRRGRTGWGDAIDVSLQSVLVSRADHVLGRMIAGQLPVGGGREAYGRVGPAGAYRCADGYIHLYATPIHWPGLLELLGNPSWADDFNPGWLFDVTERELTSFQKHFSEWVADQPCDAVCDAAQELGVPIVHANDAAALLESGHLEARGYFQTLDHPVLGPARYPTAAYKLSETPVRMERAAPALGQDNDLLAALPGRQAATPASPSPEAQEQGGGPLKGIRVLAIAKVWAGPYAARMLAMLGAEVIKVESRNTLDSMRSYDTEDIDKSAIFQAINPEVLSVQVNMKSEEGFRHLKDMIAQSDIVLDNLRPGAMDRMGLDFASLRKIKPDIIHVSLKMNGATGPLSHQTGYAASFAALSGINTLVGYEGEPPCGINMFYGDTTAGATVALSALAALVHRELTGEGQFVDVSATEALSSMIGDSLFEYSLTGKVPRNDGNRHADLAPHGAYPCRDGEWISIAVGSDREWRMLCRVLGLPELTDDARFRSLSARQENLAALDEALSQATCDSHADALAALLRQNGVGAHKSCNTRDMIGDAHLWERRTYVTVSDRQGNLQPLVGAPWHFARAGIRLERAAPAFGEHNRYVYCDLLGLSETELQRLIEEGAVQ